MRAISRRKPIVRPGSSAAWGCLLSLWITLGCGRSQASPQDELAAEATEVAAKDPLADLEIRAFPLLIWSAYHVEQEYFDKARFDPAGQLAGAAAGMGKHTPEVFAEVRKDVLHVRVGAATSEFRLDDLPTLAAAADRLEQVLVFAQGVLALEPEPLHELEYAAINGFFALLDPHTILLTPEEHTDLGVRTKGQFGGVGAEIRADMRRIVIVRVLPGMPAERAGVRGGDIVLKIGDQSTVNMSATDAQQLLRGPVGTKVAVKLRRGAELMEVEIERDVIHIDSVHAELLPQGIGLIRITNFQEDTGSRVKAAFSELAEGGALRGVVFDLRGNAGGLLVQATAVLDQLVERGELVVVRSAMGREVDRAQPELELPATASIVALVDEGSASAAEIVSGGLRALGRGIVVGRSTFGKGTVQMVKAATPYGRELALKLTLAEYLVAGDRRIQGIGVEPDVVLRPVQMTRIPGVVRYYDGERFERQRERYRSAALPSGKHESKPGASVEAAPDVYYLDVPAEGGTERELDDPEVRLAHELAIALVGTDDDAERHDRLRAVLPGIGGREHRAVEAALLDAGVDWSAPASPPEASKLSISASIAGKGAIAAGAPFELELAVGNPAAHPIHRVHAITDCVHDELDGIEIAFGRIGPGEIVRRRVQLHVMPWHPTFSDDLTIDVHAGEPDADPDGRARVRLDVEGADKPSFSFDAWIVDDPSAAATAPRRPQAPLLPGDEPFVVRGNGDGMLQANEAVLLAFMAHNEGPGDGRDVRVLLRNSSGQQGLIEEGIVELGALAAGERKLGAFGVTIAAEANPALPMELELIVGDATLREQTGDRLRLRVLESGSVLEPWSPAVPFVVRQKLPLFSGAFAGAGVAAWTDPGLILSASGRVGDFYAFSADHGRRVYAQAQGEALDRLEGAKKAVTLRQRSDLEALHWRPTALPPRIALVPLVVRTEQASIVVSGTAEHPQGVRDVVVMRRPPTPGGDDEKVDYTAAEGGSVLQFRAEVPLEIGPNRIVVIARDAAKVQGRVERWVFREVPSVRGAEAGASPGPRGP